MCKSLLLIKKQVIRNIQASTPPFTYIHGPHLHVGISKHEDLFESITVYICVCMYYTVCWSQYRSNGSSFKKVWGRVQNGLRPTFNFHEIHPIQKKFNLCLFSMLLQNLLNFFLTFFSSFLKSKFLLNQGRKAKQKIALFSSAGIALRILLFFVGVLPGLWNVKLTFLIQRHLQEHIVAFVKMLPIYLNSFLD